MGFRQWLTVILVTILLGLVTTITIIAFVHEIRDDQSRFLMIKSYSDLFLPVLFMVVGYWFGKDINDNR